MKQQLSRALWVVGGIRAVVVRGDVASDEPGLSPVDGRVAVLEVHLGFPQRLHLGTPQDEPRLVRLENGEVVESLPVCGDHLLTSHRVDRVLLTSLTWSV